MDEKSRDTVTVFHLYRKDGSALFLHPFDDPARLIEIVKSSELEGKYGREPRVESFTLFRNDLYRLVDIAARRWASEVHFFPRLLLSAGVLLSFYLVMTFVFHDPIPMIDELGIGVALALGTYFMLSRLDNRSDFVVKQAQVLREKIDKIYFQESPFVLEIEQILDRNDEETPEQIIQSLTGLPESPLAIENEDEAVRFMSYLERRFSDKEVRRQERILGRFVGANGSTAAKIVDGLSRWAEARKADLALFVLYRQMKRSLKPVK